MDIPGIPNRDTVNLVESRIPGGRFWINGVIALAMLALTVALCRYLYTSLVSPITHWIVARGDFGDLTLWNLLISSLVSGCVIWIIWSLTKIIEKTARKVGAVAHATYEILGFLGTHNRVIENLEDRVYALEKHEASTSAQAGS